MDHSEEPTQAPDQPLAVGPLLRVRQRGQELHVADQVRQAELEDHAEFAMIPPIGREIVAAQHPVELRPQYVDQHVSAPRGVDFEQRVQSGPEAPDPLGLTVLLVPGLIDIEPVLVGQVFEQLRVGLFQPRLTLAMILANCPREMVKPITSRTNLRTVENEAWQTPLR